MTENLRPFLECRQCGARIVLPYSTPEGKPISQIGWPSDKWSRMFLCLECGHVCAYSALDAHWEPFQQQAHTPSSNGDHVVCSEIHCATEGCKALLRIHAVWNASPPDKRLADAISAQRFHVSCSNGHPAEAQIGMSVRPCPADTEWWSV